MRKSLICLGLDLGGPVERIRFEEDHWGMEGHCGFLPALSHPLMIHSVAMIFVPRHMHETLTYF